MDNNNKLKILAASDLHGDSSAALNLAKKAKTENVDLVILCGDILGFSETKNIIKPFKDLNKKVLIIPGNWDSFADIDFISKHYKIKNLHGYSTEYNGIGFFGAGGAEGPGLGRIGEQDLLHALQKAHSGLEGIEKKVMITHMHPSKSKSEFSGIPGSEAISEAIKKFKPSLLLHGHIHEASGFEDMIDNTRVINVGKEGKILEI